MYRGNRTAKPLAAGGAIRKPFHIPGLHREPSKNAGRAESLQLLHRLLYKIDIKESKPPRRLSGYGQERHLFSTTFNDV